MLLKRHHFWLAFWEGSPMPASQHDDGFTKRTLMSLITEAAEAETAATRVRIQVFALAKEHGIKTPKVERATS
jgi:hypothetical protein